MATQASSRVPSAAANGKHGHSLISDAKFRRLYELTLRLRLGVQQANGRGHALAGREAALAAVACELRSGDTLVADRSIPAASEAANASTPFSDRVIAAIARATADRLENNGQVTILFSGRTAQPLLNEVRWIAGAAKLPVLFVEDAPAPDKKPDTRTRRAAAPRANLISIPVDASDVIALYRVAHESIARAREGSGPTRILCARWPSRNRATEDAVEHLERWLEARGLSAQEWHREILADAEAVPSGFAETIFTEVL
jgi:hypothetical protein